MTDDNRLDDACWRGDVALAACAYFASSLIALAAVWFGAECLPRADGALDRRPRLLGAVVSRDARHYSEIARWGYEYRPRQRSNVAFFPLYPLAALDVALVCGISVDAALVMPEQWMHDERRLPYRSMH